MTLETRSVVVLTTAHVSEATAQALSSGALGETVLATPYGWIVKARHRGALHNDLRDLEAICEWAVKNGFDWIEFDRDAESIESLPVFDW